MPVAVVKLGSSIVATDSGELRLSGVNKRVETMLTMTGAHNFLKMFPDEAGAIQSFGG